MLTSQAGQNLFGSPNIRMCFGHFPLVTGVISRLRQKVPTRICGCRKTSDESHMMAPQTIIARVDDSLWQQTVSAALDQTPAVLIDVSDPTASLQWEIEQLRKSSHKCVFIAERDHLCLWTERSSGDSEAQSSIMNLVGNDEVLTYSAQSKL